MSSDARSVGWGLLSSCSLTWDPTSLGVLVMPTRPCRYGVKSHLVPHCHYLKSLGIAQEELPQLILSRPQVLVSCRDLPCSKGPGLQSWALGFIREAVLHL